MREKPWGVCEAAAAIAARELTPAGLLEACLATIARDDALLQAWQHVDAEDARALARRGASGGHRRPLEGIPIGVKDIIDTAAMPTEYGSAFYRGHRPAADAAAVARLRQAGAVILGKTVTTEFASVAPSRTRNPHNPDHTPGGSSSGSAAAVAAGMVPAAIGTQTAGSIIRPAAYCGIVGYKPSFGLIDVMGTKPLAPSFDTIGVLARSIADAALVASVLAARPSLAATGEGSNPAIGIYLPPWSDRGEPAALAAVHYAAKRARGHGARLHGVSEIAGFADLLAAHQNVMDWEMVHNLGREMREGESIIDPVTLENLKMREGRMSERACGRAQAWLVAARRRLAEAMAGLDALIVPATPGEAPFGFASTGSSDFNRGWTALHAPCVTVPVGVGRKGMPLGVQVVAPEGEDRAALAVAALVERSLGPERPRLA